MLIGIKNLECAVVPDGSRVAAIPLDATFKADSPFFVLISGLSTGAPLPRSHLSAYLQNECEEEKPKEGEEPKPEGEKKKVKKAKTEKYWDWEIANETKPLWMQNPKYLQKDEYQEFY
ncbi:hypothetical protein K1719_027948 [Acacia pycnantha]|nr:hypothetical protein K1719_027948 [Acacia pycnantha]